MLEILEERANELLSYYNHQNIEALNKVTRTTLDTIRKRIQATATILYKERTQNPDDDGETLAPFFLSHLILKIPQVSMSPTLDEVQKAINKCTHMILSVTKSITLVSYILPSFLFFLHKPVRIRALLGQDPPLSLFFPVIKSVTLV